MNVELGVALSEDLRAVARQFDVDAQALARDIISDGLVAFLRNEEAYQARLLAKHVRVRKFRTGLSVNRKR